MRRRVVIFCIAAITGVLVGACRDEGAGDVVVLRVANWAGPGNDPAFVRMVRGIREEFERRHPGVRVQMEHIPGAGQYEPKLLMMFVSGHAPDVIQLDASSAAVFVDNGVLLDLAPRFEADPDITPDVYFGNVLAVGQRGKALYAVPLDFTPMVMIYNKRLFDEAGVSYPRDGWTWAEFLATSRALTVRPTDGSTPTQFGFHFTNWMPGWIPWIWANGGDVLSPDGSSAVGYFDGAESREAIRFLVDLIVKYRVAPNLSESMAAGVDLFRAGRAAIHLTGHWSLLDYRADEMDLGVVGVPTNNGERVTVMYASSLAVSRASPRAHLAWEYVKYMTSAEVQTKWVSTGLAISANKAVARGYADDPIETAFLREAQYARPPWGSRVERYPFCEDLGREMMDDILHGGDPVDQAMHRAARLIQAGIGGR